MFKRFIAPLLFLLTGTITAQTVLPSITVPAGYTATSVTIQLTPAVATTVPVANPPVVNPPVVTPPVVVTSPAVPAGILPVPPVGVAVPTFGAGLNGYLNGWLPFAGTNYAGYADVSALPVNALDATVTQGVWGPNFLNPSFIGRCVFDSRTQPMAVFSSILYAGPSDNVPFPVFAGPTEGANGDGGDDHLLCLDAYSGWIYEVYQYKNNGNGSISAGGAVVWDAFGSAIRPVGDSSTDAAGLPIFPFLPTYDEAVAGTINHVMRITFNNTKCGPGGASMFIPPATAGACNNYGVNAVMGARLRLKASFDTSAYPADIRGLLEAGKKTGWIIADNGQTGGIPILPDPRWSDFTILKTNGPHISDLQMLDTGAFLTTSTAPTGVLPLINSFTQSVANGVVTLSWNVTSPTPFYGVIEKIGPVRGAATGSVTGLPYAAGTVYKFNAKNAFGTVSTTVTTP